MIRLIVYCLAGLAASIPAPAGAFASKSDAGKALAVAQGQPLTPQMFGARGDGLADDSAAIEAWLASGSPLFCNGTYKLTRGVAVQLKPDGGLSLQGAGRQLCKFLLTTPAAGLTVRGGRPDIYHTPEVVIHDIGLAPGVVMTRPALEVQFTGGAGMTDPTFDLRDIAVKPTTQAFYAPTCIRLDNARNGVLQGVNCEGRRGRWAAGSRGIVIDGDSQPTELTLRDINVYFMDTGIALDGTWQGVSINQVACVACRVGVKAEASDNNGGWLRVNDSHFNVEDYGVETINIVDVNVNGTFTLLNELGESRTSIHACISLTMLSQATMFAKVDNNGCDGTALRSTPKVGVYMTSALKPASFLMESRIDGNSFYTLDWGVYLDNATSVAVGPNTYAMTTRGTVWNGSTGGGIFRNTKTPGDETLRSGAD